MIVLTLSLLPLLINSSPLQSAKRQNVGDLLKDILGNPGMIMGMASVTAPSKTIEMPPQVRPAAKRVRLLYGPYNFKAANVSKHHSDSWR